MPPPLPLSLTPHISSTPLDASLSCHSRRIKTSCKYLSSFTCFLHRSPLPFSPSCIKFTSFLPLHIHTSMPKRSTNPPHKMDKQRRTLFPEPCRDHKSMDLAVKNGSTGNHAHGGLSIGIPAPPSKWDDAHRWLVRFSRGGERQKSKKESKPRDSNADDRCLIAAVPAEQEYASPFFSTQEETKIIDCGSGTSWRNREEETGSGTVMVGLRSVCLRDVGTEMTPPAAATPSSKSPISSGHSSPKRGGEDPSIVTTTLYMRSSGKDEMWKFDPEMKELEWRAAAWDEGQRVEYMARYRQEEVRINAWENQEKRKVELEMRRVEMMALQKKEEGREEMRMKMAAIGRRAAERRAGAVARLHDKVAMVKEKAENIRITGRVPSSSISFKFSFCW